MGDANDVEVMLCPAQNDLSLHCSKNSKSSNSKVLPCTISTGKQIRSSECNPLYIFQTLFVIFKFFDNHPKNILSFIPFTHMPQKAKII